MAQPPREIGLYSCVVVVVIVVAAAAVVTDIVNV